jgi:isopenicillin-N epimerase
MADTEEDAGLLWARISEELQAEVAVTVAGNRGFLRLSAQVYNAPGEFERLAAALPEFLARSGSH